MTPKNPGVEGVYTADYKVITAFGDVSIPTITLKAIAVSKKGYLMLCAKGGGAIQTGATIAAVQGGSAEFTLTNNGGAQVNPLKINVPNELVSRFSGDCLQTTILGAGSSCTIGYTLDGAQKSGTYPLKINEGEEHEYTINIMVAALSQAVLQLSVNNLELDVGSQGVVQIVNEGNAKVTNLQFSGLPKGIQDSDFSGSCVDTGYLPLVVVDCNIKYLKDIPGNLQLELQEQELQIQ